MLTVIAILINAILLIGIILLALFFLSIVYVVLMATFKDLARRLSLTQPRE